MAHFRILLAAVMLGVGGLGAAFWLLPRGVGEYGDSPDKLWKAQVNDLTQGTLRGTRRRYLEVSIVRNTDGTSVWRQQIPCTITDTVPDYGDRRARYIVWSSDSTRFSVRTTNGATVTVPVAVAVKAPSIERAK